MNLNLSYNADEDNKDNVAALDLNYGAGGGDKSNGNRYGCGYAASTL